MPGVVRPSDRPGIQSRPGGCLIGRYEGGKSVSDEVVELSGWLGPVGKIMRTDGWTDTTLAARMVEASDRAEEISGNFGK